MIVSGELGPGDRLPKEADLADRLGLSRNSLREAVKALSLIHVLDGRQGDGTDVTSLEPPHPRTAHRDLRGGRLPAARPGPLVGDRPRRRRRGVAAPGPAGLEPVHPLRGAAEDGGAFGLAEVLDEGTGELPHLVVARGEGTDRPVGAVHQPLRSEDLDGVLDVRRDLPGVPGVPMGLGDQAGYLGGHVGQRGEPGDARRPRLPLPVRDVRLGQVVEDEVDLGQLPYHVDGHRQLRYQHQQVVHQPGGPDGAQPAEHLGPAEPARVGLVLYLVPDAGQPFAARAGTERGDPVGDVGGGEVDPADHALDQPIVGAGRGEELGGLPLVADRLYQHRVRHPAVGDLPQVVDRVRAAQRSQGIAVHPRVLVLDRVPQVVVRIDDHDVGTGASGRSRPCAINSCHSSGGGGAAAARSALRSKWAALPAPTTTLATVGCAPAKTSAACGSVVPYSRHTAAIRRAFSTSSAGASPYSYLPPSSGQSRASRPLLKTPTLSTDTPCFSHAGSSSSSAGCSSRVYRPASMMVSISVSVTNRCRICTCFEPTPTAPTTPADRSSCSAAYPSVSAVSGWSDSSGSWIRAISTRSRPSRCRLSSRLRRTPVPVKSHCRRSVAGTSKPLSRSRPPSPARVGTISRPTLVE